MENLSKKHREAFDKLCPDNQNLETQKNEYEIHLSLSPKLCVAVYRIYDLRKFICFRLFL